MIRKYEEKDKDFLQEQDTLSFFELQYHGDVIKDYIFTSVDNSDQPNGVLYFKYHYSWYGENELFNRILPCICTEDKDCKHELEEYAINWFRAQKELFEGKNAALAVWVESDETETLRTYMKLGYLESDVCPCLAYDLTKHLPEVTMPENMHVEVLPMEADHVNRFIAVTQEANHGTPDSINELWFMTGEPSYKVFVLMDGDKIVSSASTWRMTDTRAAIENIVTASAYQRRGCGKAIIAYTLGQIGNSGYQTATLSMRGENLRAHKLYHSLGFELLYNQIELLYF